ncbi:MAG: hypothetical protein CL569_13045 [Alphaproteobacteria bacterium]|nr:hypothetical protein [Alphaproteobacteria bacterium]
MPNDVGFIGLGHMGMFMVKNIAKAGYAVTVYDAKPETRDEASAISGIEVAASSADVAAQVPVLFTCLPTPESVEAVYTGDKGIAEGGSAGLITCDCSTMPPELSRSIAEAMEASGIHHMDAPIFGLPLQARDGEVFFPVSGDERHVKTLAPFLDAMGRGHQYVGESGIAGITKILQNGLGMAHAVLISEVLVTCERLGLDTDMFIELVKNVRGLGHSVYFERFAEVLVSGEKVQAPFLPPAAKDAVLAMDLAHGVDLLAPMLEESAAVYREAMERGWSKEEMLVVSRIARGRKLSDAS